MKKQLIATVMPIILVSLVCCFNISLVYALSCAPPVWDDMILESADVVFEGIAGKERELTLKEKTALTSTPLSVEKGRMNDIKIYPFTVVRGWKGIKNGDTILILRNTYWGDSFLEEENYFILSSKKIGDFYVAPLCGHSMPIKYAQDQGFIKALEKMPVTQ